MSACSFSSPNYLREELANQGPQVLSRDNPFIASNLFLALEKEASPLVKKFIEHRGEPDAVAVEDSLFEPLRLYFYYMDKREAYTLEQRSVDWIITGPEPLPMPLLQRFAGIPQRPPAIEPYPPAAPAAEAAADSPLAAGTLERESSAPAAPSNIAAQAVPKGAIVPADAPPIRRAIMNADASTAKTAPGTVQPATPQRANVARAAPSAPVTRVPVTQGTADRSTDPSPVTTSRTPSSAFPGPNTPLQGSPPPRASASAPTANARQPEASQWKSRAPSQPPADQILEASAPDDVVHTVTFPGETLRIIAGWYTGTPDNAGRIARINNIENADLLLLEQQVRIPRYLITNNQPLPQAAIERYLKELSDAPRPQPPH